MVLENEVLDNVHLNSRLNIEHYDYKIGEFYAYRMFALALIIPILKEDYTWKEEDKYYHYSANTTKEGKKTEITKEQFDAYMATGRANILSELQKPLNKTEELMEDDDSIYKDKVNTYTAKGNELTFKCQANRVKNDTETEKTTITIVYKDHLPAKYTTKTGDSSDIWTYKFGKASFEFKEKTNESN